MRTKPLQQQRPQIPGKAILLQRGSHSADLGILLKDLNLVPL